MLGNFLHTMTNSVVLVKNDGGHTGQEQTPPTTDKTSRGQEREVGDRAHPRVRRGSINGGTKMARLSAILISQRTSRKNEAGKFATTRPSLPPCDNHEPLSLSTTPRCSDRLGVNHISVSAQEASMLLRRGSAAPLCGCIWGGIYAIGAWESRVHQVIEPSFRIRDC